MAQMTLPCMASMLLFMKAVMAVMVNACGLIVTASPLVGQKKMARLIPVAHS